MDNSFDSEEEPILFLSDFLEERISSLLHDPDDLDYDFSFYNSSPEIEDYIRDQFMMNEIFGDSDSEEDLFTFY